MLQYRKVKSDINLHTYAIIADWWYVYVTYRTCDRQRQSLVSLVTAGLGTGAGSLWRLHSKGRTGSSMVTFIFWAVFIAGWRRSGCLYWWNNEQNAKWWSLSKVRRLHGQAQPRRRMWLFLLEQNRSMVIWTLSFWRRIRIFMSSFKLFCDSKLLLTFPLDRFHSHIDNQEQTETNTWNNYSFIPIIVVVF